MHSIVHLIDTLGPGGAETVFVDLVRGLDPERFRSVPVVVGKGWPYEALRSAGIDATIVPTTGSFDLGYLSGLVRVVRAAGASLIQSHALTANVYACLAGWRTRIPVVTTFHGVVDLGEHDRWRVPKRAVIRRRAGAVVCVSEHLRQAAARQLGVPSNRLVVIHNGVDTGRFAAGRVSRFRETLGVAENGFVIGAVGNTRPEKGFDRLLQAAPGILRQIPNAAIAIIGQRQEPHATELERIHGALGLDGRVRIVGFQDDMPDVLAGIDCLVVPSLSEGFSLVTIQAMAAGVPVVATRCGGPAEIITDGQDGILVDPGDMESMVDAVATLARSPERRASLALAGRATAGGRFSLEGMIRRYADLYDSLLG